MPPDRNPNPEGWEAPVEEMVGTVFDGSR